MDYCKLDSDLLEFVTDSSKLKIGKKTPGSHILICPVEDICKDITHGLILPWNITDHLIRKLQPLNLQFIVPVLEPK